jgi:hypothetical protein
MKKVTENINGRINQSRRIYELKDGFFVKYHRRKKRMKTNEKHIIHGIASKKQIFEI